MSPEHHRRTSALPPYGSGPAPPIAPPLPPQQQYTGARYALNKVFGFPSRAIGKQEVRSSLRLPTLSSDNASTGHKTGLEISSLSINEQGTHALLAGRDIFKTVRVEEGSCTEDANIRAAIRTYDATNSGTNVTSSRSKDAPDIHDVAWAKGTTGNLIAAATYNGPIILYDLNRLGIEIARLSEHRRQVHRVTFNPHAGYMLLSASQDGTVKLWDIRDFQRNVATFKNRSTFYSQNDGVRDVKWSPTNGTEFALGTDSGWVQKWDCTMGKSAKTKIAGHSAAIHTIDWHPDGKHLLSASADKTVRVWNLAAEGRRNKAAYEIKTPYPLRNARWRPQCQSSVPNDNGARQCTQIATSYERDYPLIHIWDYRRPQLPFREVESHFATSPTDLLWHSQDLLWTVGREGTFLQTDVKYATKVMDKRPIQAFAVSPLGEVNCVTHKRAGRSKALSGSEAARHKQDADGKPSKLGTERLSRGSVDDGLDESFLSASFKRPSHKRSESMRDGVFGTPSSWDKISDRTISLDDILSKKRSFRPGQVAARGLLPGAPNLLLSTYFAQKYKARSYTLPVTVESMLDIQAGFEQNAKYAQHASMYRMAQSWKLVGQMLAKELQRRAVRQRERRVAGRNRKPQMIPGNDSPLVERAKMLFGDDRRQASKPGTPLSRPSGIAGLLQSEQVQSSSNVPTPLVKPVSETMVHAHPPDLDSDETLALPPAIMSPHAYRRLSGSHPLHPLHDSGQSRARSRPGLAQDITERRAMVSNWRAQPKEPLTLEPLSQPPGLTKHASNESFGMLLSFSDRGGSFLSAKSQTMNTVPEDLKNSSSDSSFDFGEGRSSQRIVSDGSVLGMAKDESPAAEIRQESVDLQTTGSKQGTPHREFKYDIQTLLRNNQESFSSESEAHTASKGSVEGHEIENLEASATIVPASQHRRAGTNSSSASHARPAVLEHADAGALPTFRTQPESDANKEPFIPEDFLATDIDTAKDQGSPFTLIAMLQQLLAYHTSTLADAQASTHFLLLLMPLLPETHPLPQEEIDATLAHYTEHLAALDYSDDSIYSILRTSFEHLINAGLQPLLVESILATYHTQLQSYSLFNSAAMLRRLAYPAFPAVYEQALRDVQVGFRCGACRKLINNPTDKWRCESCRARQAECPICWCADSPYDAPRKNRKKPLPPPPLAGSGHEVFDEGAGATGPEPEPDGGGAADDGHARPSRRAILYSTCLLCGHSAHAACLAVWHAVDAARGPAHASALPVSQGACPTSGCVCFCIARPEVPQRPSSRQRHSHGSIRRRSGQPLDEDWGGRRESVASRRHFGSSGLVGDDARKN